jgi:hypothetical protein
MGPPFMAVFFHGAAPVWQSAPELTSSFHKFFSSASVAALPGSPFSLNCSRQSEVEITNRRTVSNRGSPTQYGGFFRLRAMFIKLTRRQDALMLPTTFCVIWNQFMLRAPCAHLSFFA